LRGGVGALGDEEQGAVGEELRGGLALGGAGQPARFGAPGGVDLPQRGPVGLAVRLELADRRDQPGAVRGEPQAAHPPQRDVVGELEPGTNHVFPPVSLRTVRSDPIRNAEPRKGAGGPCAQRPAPAPPEGAPAPGRGTARAERTVRGGGPIPLEGGGARGAEGTAARRASAEGGGGRRAEGTAARRASVEG